MTFSRAHGGHFSIGAAALGIMLRYVQNDEEKPESGGALLGRHILDTWDIVVDQVTTPQHEDRSERFRFFRARLQHQQLIDEAWQQTGGTCTYLGEWHTHPESVPTPSYVDLIDWRRKLLFDRFSSHLFFIIVGTAEVRVWEGHRWCTKLLPLRDCA